MKQNLEEIRSYVRTKFEGDSSGHDYWHLVRVVNNARTIAATEGGNLFLIEVAAWCHDIGDYKLGDTESPETQITRLLRELNMGEDFIKSVIDIVHSVSFKGAGVDTNPGTLEGKIVQDADRLDAIGAVGIARCFAYSGHKGTLMHHPERKPIMHQRFEDYKSADGTAIMHFYEKLLLLKDRMQTDTGRKMAEQRHAYMESFLAQFYKEWGS